jgi:hypothetical protein
MDDVDGDKGDQPYSDSEENESGSCEDSDTSDDDYVENEEQNIEAYEDQAARLHEEPTYVAASVVAVKDRWTKLNTLFQNAVILIKEDATQAMNSSHMQNLFTVRCKPDHLCALCRVKTDLRHQIQAATSTQEQSQLITTWLKHGISSAFVGLPCHNIIESDCNAFTIAADDTKKRKFAQLISGAASDHNETPQERKKIINAEVQAKIDEAKQAFSAAMAKTEEAQQAAKTAELASEQAKKAAFIAERAEQATNDAKKAKLNAEVSRLEMRNAVGSAEAEIMALKAQIANDRLAVEARVAAMEAKRLDEKAASLDEKAASLDEKATNLAREADAIAKALYEKAGVKADSNAAGVSSQVQKIETAHARVHQLFYGLGNLGNETTAGAQASSMKVDSKRIGPEAKCTPYEILELVDNAGKLDLNNWEVDSESDVQDERLEPSSVGVKPKDFMHDLTTFYTYLNKGFRSAQVVKVKSDVESRVATTVHQIHNWRKGVEPLMFYIPGKSNEDKGWQPIWNAILFEVGSIVKGDHNVTIQQDVVAGRNFVNRRIDMSASNNAEHLRAALPFMCKCPIELKPLGRKNQSVESLHEEGGRQVIGLLARMLQHYFDFGGIGVDMKCHGAVVTLASIEIIEMELSNIGTADVRLDIRRSGICWFLNAETSTHLCAVVDASETNENAVPETSEEQGVKKQVGKKQVGKKQVGKKQVGKKLVGKKLVDKKSFVKKENFVQDGFQALAKLLLISLKEDDIFTTKGKIFLASNPEEKVELVRDQFLGAGMFGCVYKLDNNLVVKLPKSYRAVCLLECESRILRKLSHPCIPKCDSDDKSWCTVVFEARCEAAELKGLLIRGIVGKPASSIAPDDVVTLAAIHQGVGEALQHAHKRKCIHLDIRPKNIIYVAERGGQIKAQLIDWGCSSPVNFTLPGFRGSLPFAHDMLLLESIERKTIRAIPGFDWASLAYTMAALLSGNDGQAPWWGFYNRNLIQNYLNRRNSQAVLLIDESDLPVTIKEQLMSALPFISPSPPDFASSQSVLIDPDSVSLPDVVVN